MKYLLLQDGLPCWDSAITISPNREDIENEIKRLTDIQTESNEKADRIAADPNRQRGWVFMATKTNHVYSIREIPDNPV